MEKDRTILALGSVYLFFIILYWVVILLPFTYKEFSFTFTIMYYMSPWGLALFGPGGIFLLFSSILTLIFLTSWEDALNAKLDIGYQGWSCKIGYYLGMIGAGFGLGHLGALIPTVTYFPSPFLPAGGLTLTISLFITGFLLYLKTRKKMQIIDTSGKPATLMPSPITPTESRSEDLVRPIAHPKCEMCQDTGICYKCAGLGEIENDAGELITCPICKGTGSCVCEKSI